ncbi:MAG: transposase [Myxococcales bacterium]|nr:transposase [Myxococcales bacterium]MCA9631943.1 transposase [Myxococcales bacterium]MCB9548123.1 transposase [Myxococcales bacterium]
MARRRRHFTPEQKAAIVRRHLIDKVEVSVICEENDIQPSVFYDWRNQLFENAAVALQPRRSDPRQHALEAGQRKVEELEARLAHKDQVIATLAERNIKLEKGSGGR